MTKASTEAVQLTRDELRKALLGTVPKPKSMLIELFGVEVELRQPNLGAILKTRDASDDVSRAIDMIIEYAYVPGTDDHVFEDTDVAVIKKWPFGEDLARLNGAIADLTGVDIETATEELRDDPLDESS